MSVEEVRPEPSERRNFIGWTVLVLLFGFLAIGAIVQAVNPPKNPGPKRYEGENLQLRFVVSSVENFRQATTLGKATPESIEKQAKDARASLDPIISSLVEDAEEKPEAARLYAVMRTEQGNAIPEKMLQVLRKSKDPLDQTYAEIYGAKKIDPARAQQLALALPEEPFSNQLAAIHALEKGGSTSAREQKISRWFTVRLFAIAFVGFGLIFTGILLLGIYLYGRRHGRFTPKGHPIGRVTLPNADRLAVRAAQILGGYLVLSLLVPSLLPPGNIRTVGMGFLVCLFVVSLAAVPISGKRITLRSIGLHTEDFGKNVLWGILGFIAEVPVTAALFGISAIVFSFLPPPSHPIDQQFQQVKGFLDVLPILFLASIVAPFWEEILFRGVLFPALGRVSGSVLSGALYSSFLFGIIHPQGPSMAFVLAGVGAMSCAVAFQTRSLVPSIVLHFLHNTALVIVSTMIR